MFCPTPLVGPFAADASLHLIADALCDGVVNDEAPPSIVRLQLDGDGLRVGLFPLGAEHPSDHLLGFCAPEDWYGIGVVAGGWAASLTDRCGHGRTRVQVVTLLSCSGELAHRTHVADPDHPLARMAPEGLPAGEQVDLLHRALGLPTAPPPAPVQAYWAVEWLCSLLDHSADSWHEAVAQHPAFRLLATGDAPDIEALVDIGSGRRTVSVSPDGDGAGAGEAPGAKDNLDGFVLATESFARVCSWSRLRDLAIDERFVAPELLGDDAAWLDVGSFARWLLARCPPLSMLRAAVQCELPAPVAAAVERALDRTGVPHSIWPEATDDH